MADANDRFLAAAADLDLTIDVVRYPAGTRTAADDAAAIGCEVGLAEAELAEPRPLALRGGTTASCSGGATHDTEGPWRARRARRG